MGGYEVRVPRRGRHATRAYAVRRAREVAVRDAVQVFGDPEVTLRRVPIPVIGPRREYRVRFTQATRTANGTAIEGFAYDVPGPASPEA